MENSIHKIGLKDKFLPWIVLIGILGLLLLTGSAFYIKSSLVPQGLTIHIPTSTPEAVVIGSINSKKYYFPWCYGSRRLKEGQEQVFSSKEEAQKAGFVAGGACKGNE